MRSINSNREIKTNGGFAPNGSSLKDLKCAHSDYQASDESGIVIFRPKPSA